MKKLLGVIILGTVMSCTALTASADNIAINVDGQALVSDVAPQIIESRTMVPLRVIFEAVGADVAWDQESQTVTATKGDTVIKMTIGKNHFYKNNDKIALDVPAQIVNERTLVPVRAISESLGCEVKWDAETKTVSIISVADVDATTVAATEATTEATTEAVTQDDAWIDEMLTQNVKPRAIEASAYEDDLAYSLHCNGRYDLEQSVLPKYIENNKKTLAQSIQKDPDKFSDTIISAWDDAAKKYALQYLAECDKKYSVSSEEDIDKFIEDAIGITHLSSEENIAFSYNQIDNDTYCMLIELSDETELTLCSYIAVVYNEAYGFKYFTLENTISFSNELKNPAMVCFVTASDRGNYGIVIERDDKENFLYFIPQIIAKERE